MTELVGQTECPSCGETAVVKLLGDLPEAITAQQLKVLVVVRDLFDPFEGIFPGPSMVAGILEKSVSTVSKQLDILQRKGWIVRNQNGLVVAVRKNGEKS